MKRIELTDNIPDMMSTNVNAVYSEEKKLWEVTVSSISIGTCAKTGKPLYFQDTETFEIKQCDEFVIPWAVLKFNGINTDFIDEALDK